MSRVEPPPHTALAMADGVMPPHNRLARIVSGEQLPVGVSSILVGDKVLRVDVKIHRKSPAAAAAAVVIPAAVVLVTSRATKSTFQGFPCGISIVLQTQRQASIVSSSSFFFFAPDRESNAAAAVAFVSCRRHFSLFPSLGTSGRTTLSKGPLR